MFDLRISDGGNSLVLGHRRSDYDLTQVTGLDGVEVDIGASQGFEQVGETISEMTINSREIGVIGKVDNFTREQLHALNYMLRPRAQVRLYFEDKYWIDCVVKSAPVFSYELKKAVFAFSLLAAYPYWKSVTENYYKLGGTTGGFCFPVSYNTPHNFGLFAPTLFLNCRNNGNTDVDYTAEVYCTSGTVEGITLTNAQNQKYLSVSTELSSGDALRIYRENNVLKVVKISAGVETNVFSDMDEDSNLFLMAVGDNVIRADTNGGSGVIEVAIRFNDTLTGVYYGI